MVSFHRGCCLQAVAATAMCAWAGSAASIEIAMNPAPPRRLPVFVAAPGAALLLVLVQLPDFSTPMNSIALSLEKLSLRDRTEPDRGAEPNDLLSDDKG